MVKIGDSKGFSLVFPDSSIGSNVCLLSDESLGAMVPKVSITVVATAIRVTKKAKK